MLVPIDLAVVVKHLMAKDQGDEFFDSLACQSLMPSGEHGTDEKPVQSREYICMRHSAVYVVELNGGKLSSRQKRIFLDAVVFQFLNEITAAGERRCVSVAIEQRPKQLM